ncbi:MAG: LysR family transcriptional regulator [Oscillospiraceae bacterium]
MELEQLRIFCAAAERGSLSRAASALYISHSTVSRAVSALEARSREALFARQPGRQADGGRARCSSGRQRAAALAESWRAKSETQEERYEKKRNISAARLAAAGRGVRCGPAARRARQRHRHGQRRRQLFRRARGSWYHDYVYLCASWGIIDGKENGQFCPTDSLKRGEFMKLLTLIGGLAPIPGTPASTGRSPIGRYSTTTASSGAWTSPAPAPPWSSP